MRSLILSYFDALRGPMIFLASPLQSIPEELERRIPGFMDIYEREFFITVEEDVTIASKIFDINSEVARGHKELLQVSVVLNEEGINVQLAGLLKGLLDTFAKYCQTIPDLYLAFHPILQDASKKRQEILLYFNHFSEIIQSAIKTVRETNLNYQILFKNAREGIILIDYKTAQIIDANQKAEKLLGQTLETICRKTPLELGMLVGEDYSDLRKRILEQIYDEKTPPFKSNFRRPDDRVIPLEVSANKIHIWDRDIVQIIFREIVYSNDRRR